MSGDATTSRQHIIAPIVVLLLVAAASVVIGRILTPLSAPAVEGYSDAVGAVEVLCGSKVAFVTPGSLLLLRERTQPAPDLIDRSPEAMRYNIASFDKSGQPVPAALALVEENGLYYRMVRSTFILPKVSSAEVGNGRLKLSCVVRDNGTQAKMIRFLMTRPLFVEVSTGAGQGSLHVLANTRESVTIRDKGAIDFRLDLPFLNTAAANRLTARSFLQAGTILMTSYYAEHDLGEVQQALGRKLPASVRFTAAEPRQPLYTADYGMRYKDQLSGEYQFMNNVYMMYAEARPPTLTFLIDLRVPTPQQLQAGNMHVVFSTYAEGQGHDECRGKQPLRPMGHRSNDGIVALAFTADGPHHFKLVAYTDCYSPDACAAVRLPYEATTMHLALEASPQSITIMSTWRSSANSGSLKRVALGRYRSCAKNSFGRLYDRPARTSPSSPNIVMEADAAWVSLVRAVHLGRVNLLKLHDTA